MLLKLNTVDEDVTIIKEFKSILSYGINEGAKKEFFERIKNYYNLNENQIYYEDDVLKNKEEFFSNVLTNSLFAKNKSIFINNATDKLIDIVEHCISKVDQNTKLFIFSGLLEKKSKLRKLFEVSEEIGIIPMYEDDERTLLNYVKKELNGFKGLTTEVTYLIISNSKLDRRVIQNEILKIKTFFNNKIINKKLLENLLNHKKESDFDEIKNVAILGDKTKLNKLLSSDNINREDVFFYLNSIIFKFKKIKELLNNGHTNIQNIIDSARPPIFWKEKPILEKQLKIWSKKNIDKIINILNETEILAKKNSQIESSIIFNNLLVNICKEASS